MIRKATAHDYKKIAMALYNKKIPYITTAHSKEDIKNNRQYVIEEEGKIIAIVSIVYDAQYNYYAIKRLCVLNKKNNGKGLLVVLVLIIIALAGYIAYKGFVSKPVEINAPESVYGV